MLAGGLLLGSGTSDAPMLAPPPAGAGPPLPGWYPDPKAEARLRYWDGRDWTDRTAS